MQFANSDAAGAAGCPVPPSRLRFTPSRPGGWGGGAPAVPLLGAGGSMWIRAASRSPVLPPRWCGSIEWGTGRRHSIRSPVSRRYRVSSFAGDRSVRPGSRPPSQRVIGEMCRSAGFTRAVPGNVQQWCAAAPTSCPRALCMMWCAAVVAARHSGRGGYRSANPRRPLPIVAAEASLRPAAPVAACARVRPGQSHQTGMMYTDDARMRATLSPERSVAATLVIPHLVKTELFEKIAASRERHLD